MVFWFVTAGEVRERERAKKKKKERKKNALSFVLPKQLTPERRTRRKKKLGPSKKKTALLHLERRAYFKRGRRNEETKRENERGVMKNGFFFSSVFSRCRKERRTTLDPEGIPNV